MRKKIIYTETAKERLSNLHSEVDAKIEVYLQEKKYVPGDDFIEITASDIDSVSEKIRIIRPTSVSSMRKFIPIVYSIFGVMSIFYGGFLRKIS